MVFDPKQPDSFRSARWGTTTNPDLAFVSLNGPLPRRIVLDPFPCSQHRPTFIFPYKSYRTHTNYPTKAGTNFRKANWQLFESILNRDTGILPDPVTCNINEAYEMMHQLLLNTAKQCIPRGRRKSYIPTWDQESQTKYDEFVNARRPSEADHKANDLIQHLNPNRRKRWVEAVESMDFSHSSRVAWQTFNRLTGRSNKPKKCPVSPNAIAHQLLCNGRYKNADKDVTRAVKREIKQHWVSPTCNTELSVPFSTQELDSAIGHLKCGKAMGPDKIPPEFLKYSGETFRTWLSKFYSACLQRLVIPKIWRKASVVAILKPKKTANDPKSYRPISLLCVPLKVLERMLLTRLKLIIDPSLLTTQADFRSGRSTVDQIIHLTEDIESGFEERKKAGLVLVDLTATYDTVWLSGLTLKMLHVIPDHHMVRFLQELISNRRFTLQTSDGRLSRPSSLKNGVPQGSTLSLLLFNAYISDLPHT